MRQHFVSKMETEGKRGMKKSIGRKVISMLVILGVMLLLVVGMNMSALQIIKGLNEEIT